VPPVRLGILGAARIAPAAVVHPARAVSGAEVVAVAARDPVKAQAFADSHGIPRVLPDYRALVEDSGVDAVYIPLPNGLHGFWTMAALSAGKHVLCEKPFTADAEEAAVVRAAAAEHPNLVVMEAFHYRYHPLFARVRQLLDDGAVGDLRRVDVRLCFPILNRRDIRWQLDLAGGALMDAGCYTIHMLRHLAGAEPEVTTARARLMSPGVDRYVQAQYRLPGGATGRTTCSMLSAQVLRLGFTVSGDAGELRVFNPVAPHTYHRLTVRGGGHRLVEHTVRRPTYEFQLDAFVAAVSGGPPPITGPDDALANMTVIDAVYRAAGLEPRRPTPPD
jgi:predicted dehydrogenase